MPRRKISPDRRIFFGIGDRDGIRSRAIASRISASVGSRSGSSLAPLTFNLFFPPQLLSVSPTSGLLTGGTVVTLTGLFFRPGCTVLFGATPATVTSVTGEHVTVTAPAHALGAVSVTITNSDGQSSTLPNAYTYVNPTLVAVGTNLAAYSTDGGVTWHSTPIPAGTYNSVMWDGSKFVAIGANLATSVDGITWIAKSNPPRSVTAVANAAIYCRAKTLFVAPASGGPMTSVDGVTWIARTGQSLSAMGCNATRFVQVGGSAAQHSTDGTSWSNATGFTGTGLTVAWNGTTFAATGNAVNTFVSTTGTAWSAGGALPTAPSTSSLAWSSALGLFVMVGHTSGNVGISATSPTGAAWSAQTIPNSLWKSVIWDNASQLVAVGTNAVAMSPDGVNWTPGTIPVGAYVAVAAAA